MLQASASLEAVPPENEATPQQGRPPASPNPDEGELPYLKYYVYSEIPPPEKPAKIALAALSDVPLGTPVQEVERAAKAFGVDANFMKAVAKIESDFNPRERTGSYVGLFQLSKSEFGKYGSGDILNPRDNAMAAAYKFVTEAVLFEVITHKQPTFSDLYLIHQQGGEGAAEHVSHPQRIAWKSMCATQEGSAKGERWCKRAIWGNTLPAVKREWKSVDRLTSGAFVAMWRDRVDTLYARYPAPTLAAAERLR
ncbi:transglycosylase [Bradyrhizobium sp. Leo170]|nr:transglycosylase [Bradyrhizobium sp. Leo170]